MSPHAIPNGVKSPASASEASSSSTHVVKANPFGASVDPHLVKNTAYTSPATIISQSVYALASSIFSYETVGAPNLVDAHLQLWASHFKRQNAVGVVPPFHRFEPRAGSANAILGYAASNISSTGPHTAVLGANALPYMQPTLAVAAKLPLSLNVSAIDFDTATSSLVSNYSTPLAVARNLGFPVVGPVDSHSALELQYTTVLSHFLAALIKGPSLHVFDGPEFARLFAKYEDILSVADVGRLYQQLVSSVAHGDLSLEKAVDTAFETFNKVAGTNLKPFEYVGHANPETVFVAFGAHEATELAGVISKASTTSPVGLVKVRVPFPFNQEQFVASVPSSARKVIVVSAETGSTLKADVAAALFIGGRFGSVTVDEFVHPANFVWAPIPTLKVISEYEASVDPAVVLATTVSAPPAQITANTSPEGSYLFWARDNSDTVETASKLALSLSLDDSKNVAFRNKFDTTVAGGIAQSQIVSAAKNSSASTSVDAADVVLIEDVSILNHYDVLATAKPGAKIILANHKKINNNIEQDFVEKLPLDFKRTLAKSRSSLTVIDFSLIEELDAVSDSTKGFSADFLTQVAFWRASLPELDGFIVNKLLQANGNDFELLAAVLDKFVATVDEKNALKPVEIPEEWVDLEDVVPEAQIETEEVDEKAEKEDHIGDTKSEKEAEEKKEAEEEAVPLPFFPTESSFFPNPRTEVTGAEDNFHKGKSDAAIKLAFPEAYSLKKDLRPDLPVQNFVVKVQENKRLTPSEYSRNIFHIEFDVTGTGLKYEIGEALGIHGRNNSEHVESFLEFYGVDGDSLVEVTNRDDISLLEVRSARQALTDNVDFLGKPPKRFYESLAPYATDEKEKAALEKLASGAGAEELKKRQEVDFSSYVDILEEFKSARPAFDELVKIIAPLKRREYSIASSQKMHPNAVHLLIVVVDWVDSKGRTRYGHCSKYLSDLRIGDELVVSVKPSVMKLPKLPEQPIVMSGLGTGLAPFKAFIEEKIWQQQQGHKIGEIYLYMGSRHKKEEYLYGELWEAYKDAGVLTHIGAAFSRDQPQKIYIQDKIRSSIEDLTDAIVKKEGSFYLCGPTWPVPDITACLEDIVKNGAKRAGEEIKDVAKVVEDMKEDGRYILEVY
ncbi:hypothetical protein CXQ85_003588 [Candidozyma haemuli]|uniref:assimilatory sulfite reductase (NADPH) n=1 Tax=Candidozyma haemuli TaxID=45357 RepID=A0A2V1AS16_9ASCO|nr:hypothetical protein CXQ85_003588 [[Candida] haemuloni]PVH19731.1 hypothetical protein CXQ85_003588 [[Candida] haemuloni]